MKFPDDIRAARRREKLTQAQLARQVGCKQSAISMFEKGRTQVLSREKAERVFQVLKLDISTLPEEGQSSGMVGLCLKCCGNSDCPRNIPYPLGKTDVRLLPRMVSAPAGETTFCNFCGEIMDDRCPNADCPDPPLREGAFCPACGTEYVPFVETIVGDRDAWIRQRRLEIQELRELMSDDVYGGKGDEQA